MDISFLKLDTIPNDAHVLRIKDSGVYIHLRDGMMFLQERMNGCFVCSEDTAEDLIDKLNLFEFSEEIEIVAFFDANATHGLLEKQAIYN